MLDLLIVLRKSHGLNKTQMAKRLKITKSYYTMLESGQRGISKNVALSIHRQFNLDLEDILLPDRIHDQATKEAPA